jgi:foldase protein PrsA
MMKQFFPISGVLLCLAGAMRAPATLAAPPSGGPVLATVNGERITQEELVERLLRYHGKASLEALINRSVVNQEAKRQGVSVSDTDLDTRMALVKNQLGGAERYNQWLGQSGFTEGLHREQVRGTLLMEKIINKSDPIRDADLEQVVVRVILLRDEAAAKSVANILKNGGDFIQLAKERSMDPQTGQQGGLLPPLMKSDYPDVWKAVSGLKPGQTTGAVKLGDNHAILKLEQRRPAAQQSQQERERNRTRLLSVRMDQWLEAARKRAKISYGTPLPG